MSVPYSATVVILSGKTVAFLHAARFMSTADTSLTLEATSPEVKLYQRLKLTAGVVATFVELAFLVSMAFGWGPALGEALSGWLGDRPWLLLIAVAAVVAVGSELLTLPIAFWSG